MTFTDNTPCTTDANGIIKMERCILPDTWHSGNTKAECLDCAVERLRQEERDVNRDTESRLLGN